jgi:1,4-dihydroxy-2-naphthoate polyprenyltransferase
MNTTVTKDETATKSDLLKIWFKAARPAFHSVGIVPFALGSILVWKITSSFNWPVFIWGEIAVILIMLSTYYNGEFHDMKEDKLSGEMEKNKFSGGSQVMFEGKIRTRSVKIAGYVTIIMAMMIGLLLQFYYKTGDLTIALGTLGIIAGFFYSKPPFRWVESGFGEILIGFCYGWLPVAVAFYIQAGKINDIVHWISIPVACTIFNVILINEFPDYPADSLAGKTTMTVRLGKEKASVIYILVTFIGILFFVLSTSQGIAKTGLLYYIPIFIISLILSVMMYMKKYQNRKLLEIMCALTIVTNLGTCLVYILAIWLLGLTI